MQNSTEKAEVMLLLEYCQMLELSVKLYIGQAYDLIHSKMGEDFVFNYSYDDVAEKSLERALFEFKKLNNNEVLIKTCSS